MPHTEHELGAVGTNCLLRPREQNTKVPRCFPGLHSGFQPLLMSGGPPKGKPSPRQGAAWRKQAENVRVQSFPGA